MSGPYPATRSRLDLRENREELLKAAGIDPSPGQAVPQAQ
jgi:hypothetical protein